MEWLDILILFTKFKYFVAIYKELFILVGAIILVWLIVAIIIKRIVRKDERSDLLEDDSDDE